MLTGYSQLIHYLMMNTGALIATFITSTLLGLIMAWWLSFSHQQLANKLKTYFGSILLTRQILIAQDFKINNGFTLPKISLWTKIFWSIVKRLSGLYSAHVWTAARIQRSVLATNGIASYSTQHTKRKYVKKQGGWLQHNLGQWTALIKFLGFVSVTLRVDATKTFVWTISWRQRTLKFSS